jgi:hypothetical protein
LRNALRKSKVAQFLSKNAPILIFWISVFQILWIEFFCVFRSPVFGFRTSTVNLFSQLITVADTKGGKRKSSFNEKWDWEYEVGKWGGD